MDYDNKPSGPSSHEGGTGTVVGMKEQIAEKAAGAKERITDFGRKAAEKIDDSRASAADALDHTASSLNSSGDKLSSVADSAAGKVRATADYVRRTGFKDMADSVANVVKRYPGQSLAVAAILGFLVARGVRKSD
jgi:ElaB/YqjD/DUF883 family membrane-anchored ribosome-binding protein